MGSRSFRLGIDLVDVNLAHARYPLSGHYNIQYGHAVMMCTAPATNFNRNRIKKIYKDSILFGVLEMG